MNEVEIVVTSTDRSAAGLRSAEQKVEDLKRSAIKKIEEINAREIRLTADITQAEIRIVDLKRKAESATGDIKVKADADVAAAEAKLADLRRQLANIPDARAKVDVDTANAIAKVREVKTNADDAFKHRAFTVTADTSQALAAIGALIAAVGALGPVAIAITGTLAGVGAGVGAGAGAAIAGFVGIGDAMDAMGEAAKSSGGAAADNGAQVRAATQAVVDAKRNLQKANEDVKIAEDNLTRAQDDAKRAQEGLNDARRAATRMLEDYQLRAEDMALSQRSADLSVAESEARLAEMRKEGKSTSLELARAELSVEEARQRQKQTSVDARRLSEDKNAADKKGIEGSDQMVAANDRVSDANRRVQDAERGVRDARLAQTRAAEQLTEANLRLQEAMKPKGGGGGGVDKLAEAMAKLGPNAREFATFLKGFVDGPLTQLRQAGQEEFLPGVQRGLQSLRPMMSSITPAWAEFSRITGDALGGFITELGVAAPSMLSFASTSLQGLSPLKGEFQAFTAQFAAMVDRVQQTGVATEAMNQFSQIIGQLLGVIPPLIEYGLRLMATMGPDLQQVFANVGDAAGELGAAFLEFAPTAGDLLVSVSGLLVPLAELVGWLLNLNPAVTSSAIALAATVAAFLKLRAGAIVAKEVLTDLGVSFGKVKQGADDVDRSTSRAEAGVRRLGLALVAAQIASAAFGNSASEGATVAANALEKYAASGEVTSGMLKNLGYDLDTLADNTWYDKVGIGTAQVIESVTGLGAVFDNSLQHAGERLASIDQGLAQLVSGGKADQAAAAFQRLAEQAEAQGISVERLAQEFPAYREALAQAGAKADEAAGAQGRLNQAMGLTAGQILGLRGAETAYFESLARTKEALEQNGATLNVHTQRGRDNRNALDTQAQAANRYLEAILKNEGAGPKFNQALASSRAALSQTAQQFGMSETKADQFARAVIAIPAAKNVKITADTASAMSNVSGLKNAIATINGKTVTIRTVQETVYIQSGGKTVVAKSAGGRIPGPASRVDTVPAILAQGEYVVNSGATSRWLPVLDAINSGSPVSSQTLRSMGIPMTEAGPAPTGGGGGGGPVVIELRSSGAAIDDFLVELLRRAIRVRGGDVQVVLGQGAAA